MLWSEDDKEEYFLVPPVEDKPPPDRESWASSVLSEDKPEQERVWKGQEALRRASFCSKFFFNWSQPVLAAANKQQLMIEHCGNLRSEEQVAHLIPELYRHYTDYMRRSKNGGYSFMRAIFRVFTWEIAFTLFLSTLVCVLSMLAPYFVFYIVNYISSPDWACPNEPGHSWCNLKEGVIYSAGLVLSQLLMYMIQEHMIYT